MLRLPGTNRHEQHRENDGSMPLTNADEKQDDGGNDGRGSHPKPPMFQRERKNDEMRDKTDQGA